ncbi:DUF4400 domain-containing protein [Pseudomonas veronii]|uniref:Uncharacterized protein n=1 Tax=Pseudomonas veronii TaxID=76761 RepID=A0A4V1DBY7_PSEVE|nr:hypothetical protein E4167_30605 [Pseudomonas veronii]
MRRDVGRFGARREFGFIYRAPRRTRCLWPCCHGCPSALPISVHPLLIMLPASCRSALSLRGLSPQSWLSCGQRVAR